MSGMPAPTKVLAETCPECHAAPGDWCVYILSAPAKPGYALPVYQLERVGQRTKRLHNGRFHAQWLTERLAYRALELARLREFFNRFGDIFRVDP